MNSVDKLRLLENSIRIAEKATVNTGTLSNYRTELNINDIKRIYNELKTLLENE